MAKLLFSSPVLSGMTFLNLKAESLEVAFFFENFPDVVLGGVLKPVGIFGDVIGMSMEVCN